MKTGSSSLTRLAKRYFRNKGYRVENDIVEEGSSGVPRNFDLLVSRAKEKRVVQILDWKRTVGVNVIINLDKASEDIGLKKPIVISNKFSSHAKAYANRKSMLLLTRHDLQAY